jgi:hypothetical protein
MGTFSCRASAVLSMRLHLLYGVPFTEIGVVVVGTRAFDLTGSGDAALEGFGGGADHFEVGGP